jgi:hypothetical protein
MCTTCCNIKKINFATLLVCAMKVTAVTKLCSTDQMVFFIIETRCALGHIGTVRCVRHQYLVEQPSLQGYECSLL